jgi:hypothetical protein
MDERSDRRWEKDCGKLFCHYKRKKKCPLLGFPDNSTPESIMCWALSPHEVD